MNRRKACTKFKWFQLYFVDSSTIITSEQVQLLLLIQRTRGYKRTFLKIEITSSRIALESEQKFCQKLNHSHICVLFKVIPRRSICIWIWALQVQVNLIPYIQFQLRVRACSRTDSVFKVHLLCEKDYDSSLQCRTLFHLHERYAVFCNILLCCESVELIDFTESVA